MTSPTPFTQDAPKAAGVFVTTEEVADAFPFWNRDFWTKLRVRGGGPRYYNVGRRVLYRLAEVEEWIAAHAAQSTAEAKRRRAA